MKWIAIAIGTALTSRTATLNHRGRSTLSLWSSVRAHLSSVSLIACPLQRQVGFQFISRSPGLTQAREAVPAVNLPGGSEVRIGPLDDSHLPIRQVLLVIALLTCIPLTFTGSRAVIAPDRQYRSFTPYNLPARATCASKSRSARRSGTFGIVTPTSTVRRSCVVYQVFQWAARPVR